MKICVSTMIIRVKEGERDINWHCDIKGTQAWDSLNFSKAHLTLVNIRKNSILFFRFLQEFRCSNLFAVLAKRRTKFLLRVIGIFSNVRFGPILIIYSRKCVLINFFGSFPKIIACAGWAYAERISSLAKPTWKGLKVEYLGRPNRKDF
jgi:hypothetical protein